MHHRPRPTASSRAGQVTGKTLVPRLIKHRGARAALQLGAYGITVVTAVLTATRTLHPAATVSLGAFGLAVGLTIVPQQHRLFSTVPKLAPVAVGLNGSAMYIASALGAAVGGLALVLSSSATPTMAAAVIGLLAITIATTIRPATVPEGPKPPSRGEQHPYLALSAAFCRSASRRQVVIGRGLGSDPTALACGPQLATGCQN